MNVFVKQFDCQYHLVSRHEDVDYIITAGIDDSAKVWAWRNEQLELRHKLEKHALGVVSVATGDNGNCMLLCYENFIQDV